jgi:hypothetical protein
MTKKRPLWIALAGAAILGANYLGNAVNLIQLPSNLQVIRTTTKPVMDAISPYAGPLQYVVIVGVILLIGYGLDAPALAIRIYRNWKRIEHPSPAPDDLKETLAANTAELETTRNFDDVKNWRAKIARQSQHALPVGDINLQGGSVSAGDGAEAPGGHVKITAARDVNIVGTALKAGDGGTGGPGGDLNIKAGDGLTSPQAVDFIPIRSAIEYVAAQVGETFDDTCWRASRTIIRQAAIDQKLLIRGRAQIDVPGSKLLFSPIHTDISAEYWAKSEITALAVSQYWEGTDHTSPETTYAWGSLGRDEKKSYAALMVDRNQVIGIWPNAPTLHGAPQQQTNPLVPLQEALKELFDKARNSIVIRMTPVMDASEDERLSWLATALWGKVPFQVRLLISNNFEPLPHTLQKGRRVTFKNGKPLLMSADRRTNEEHVESREISILRSDLDRAIELFRAQA